jgi:hypothetical protein
VEQPSGLLDVIDVTIYAHDAKLDRLRPVKRLSVYRRGTVTELPRVRTAHNPRRHR